MFRLSRNLCIKTSQRLSGSATCVVRCFAVIEEAQVVNQGHRGAMFRRQQQELEHLEGNLHAALEVYKLLLSNQENKKSNNESNTLIDALQHISSCYEELEYWDEALRIEEEIREQLLDKELSTASNKQQMAESSYRIGKLHHRQEKWQSAHRFYQEALDLHTDPVKRGQVYISMAGIHYYRGDYPKALQTLQEQAEPCFPAHNMSLFKCLQHEGLIHRTLEDFEAALDCYQKAAEILKAQESIDGNLKRELDLDIADMLTACDQFDEALTLYVEILERTTSQNDYRDDESKPFEAVILHNIGKIHARKGDMEQAVSSLSRAVELKEHWLGEFYPELGKTLSALGACFQKALLIARMHVDDEDDPEVLLALRNIAVLKGKVGSDKADS